MKNIKPELTKEGEKLASDIMSSEPFQRIYGSARELITSTLIAVFIAGGEYVENMYKTNIKMKK